MLFFLFLRGGGPCWGRRPVLHSGAALYSNCINSLIFYIFMKPSLYRLVFKEILSYSNGKGGIFLSYKVEIGKNIVSLRKLKPISQEQLALGSEMSVSYLRAIEHGRANPTLDKRPPRHIFRALLGGTRNPGRHAPSQRELSGAGRT